MSDIADAVRNLSSRMDSLMNMDSEAKAGIEGIGKQINAVLSAVQESRKHSLAQELIDEGAFDVAIAYINFLKGKSARKEVKK